MRREDTKSAMIHSYLRTKRVRFITLVLISEGHKGWKSVVRIAARSVVDERSSQLAAVQEDDIIGVIVEDTDVDCRLRDPDGDDEPINVGAALEEPDIESCLSGRSDDESADECEDEDDND